MQSALLVAAAAWLGLSFSSFTVLEGWSGANREERPVFPSQSALQKNKTLFIRTKPLTASSRTRIQQQVRPTLKIELQAARTASKLSLKKKSISSRRSQSSATTDRENRDPKDAEPHIAFGVLPKTKRDRGRIVRHTEDALSSTKRENHRLGVKDALDLAHATAAAAAATKRAPRQQTKPKTEPPPRRAVAKEKDDDGDARDKASEKDDDEEDKEEENETDDAAERGTQKRKPNAAAEDKGGDADESGDTDEDDAKDDDAGADKRQKEHKGGKKGNEPEHEDKDDDEDKEDDDESEDEEEEEGDKGGADSVADDPDFKGEQQRQQKRPHPAVHKKHHMKRTRENWFLPVEQTDFRQHDPLRAVDFASHPGSSSPLNFTPVVPWMGVLLDAGRHYFPIPWVKRLMDRLADMHYNLIHFRLTDDQGFNVLLDSHPALAYPPALNNTQRRVYTPAQLRRLNAYAAKRGIRIMPEINVPGHGGGWAGIPNLVVQCPEFCCDKGYGLPINVSHPGFNGILTDVIREVVDIFDKPPFLHLGGDEVNMARPCFEEAGADMFDYQVFEHDLKKILQNASYPEEQVVRWELTGQRSVERAGGVEHFWVSYPGAHHRPTGPFFVSNQLYFDTNRDQGAYEVYSRTRQNIYSPSGQRPTAVIAATFELSMEFWYDRNVLGRLLSVAMGAANHSDMHRREVDAMYEPHCKQLGFGDVVCGTMGRPVIPHSDFWFKWKSYWSVWVDDICNRLTYASPPITRFLSKPAKSAPVQRTELPQQQQTNFTLLGTPVVPYSGVIIDSTSSMTPISRLVDIVRDHIAKFGFNFVQLRLVNNHGFGYDSKVFQKLGNSILAKQQNPLYTIGQLQFLVKSALELGVKIMPEISVSTEAAGWHYGGYLVNCPQHLCSGGDVPNNVSHPLLIPMLISVIVELGKVFSSNFLHLGSDERLASAPCFVEANTSEPDFDMFERKLEGLLDVHGIPPTNILRWQNGEQWNYPERAGKITQYKVNTSCADIRKREDGSDRFFVTVDLLDGSFWDIYKRTKELVALEPTGVLADLRFLDTMKWSTLDIPHRLLAFAIAVSDRTATLDQDRFDEEFGRHLRAFGLGSPQAVPVSLHDVTYLPDRTTFVEQHCNMLTHKYVERVSRPIMPYFGVPG